MCLFQSLSLLPALAIWSDMSNVSLLVSNRCILQERPHHGDLDIVAKVRVSRFFFKQRGEDGNQPDAHCHSFSILAPVDLLRNDEPERRIARINVALSSNDSWGLMTAMIHHKQHIRIDM